MTPTLVSRSDLIGSPIVSPSGVRLGTLRELMIDVATGSVSYGVLGRGGLASVGERLFAIPWRLFGVDTQGGQLILDIAEDDLDDSNAFDPDDWPSFADRQWHDQIHRLYGIDPNWREAPPLT